MSTSDFQAAYRVFAEALDMLASTAAEPCQAMGDFNVAWELKDDVQAGKYLVGSGFLSAEQESWILALVSALDAVPSTTLPAGAGRADNLTAMNHPSWIPLRVIAAEVLDVLSTVTDDDAGALGAQ